MSDFLSHLALKILHPVQTVQPRLAARFEPPLAAIEPDRSGWSILPRVEPAETTPMRHPPLAEETSLRAAGRISPPPETSLSPRASRRSGEVAQPLPTRPERPSDLLPITVEPALPAQASQATEQEPVEVPTGQPVRPSAVDLTRTTPAMSSAAAPGLGEATRLVPPEQSSGYASRLEWLQVLSRLQQLEQEANQADTRLELSEMLPAQPPQTTAPPLKPEPPVTPPGAGVEIIEPVLSAPLTPAKPILGPTPPLAPQIRLLPAQAPISPGQVDKPVPPPSIQVTIGRIEVRATPPPLSPKKPIPATPVMSLEEYLRQRKGGKR